MRGVIGDDEVEDGLDFWNSWRSFGEETTEQAWEHMMCQ